MHGRKELLEELQPYKVEPSSNSPPTKWEMGTWDQALFASIRAVTDYLNWLGGEVQAMSEEDLGSIQDDAVF